jgi:hypothetical protein
MQGTITIRREGCYRQDNDALGRVAYGDELTSERRNTGNGS